MKTYYRHLRPYTKIRSFMRGKGYYDMTLAAHANDKVVQIGVAVCSHGDEFTKAKGRKIAKFRLEFLPTFTFPRLSRRVTKDIHYYFKMLEAMIVNGRGTEIKNLVARQQKKFDVSELGIQMKMEEQKREAQEMLKFLKKDSA